MRYLFDNLSYFSRFSRVRALLRRNVWMFLHSGLGTTWAFVEDDPMSRKSSSCEYIVNYPRELRTVDSDSVALWFRPTLYGHPLHVHGINGTEWRRQEGASASNAAANGAGDATRVSQRVLRPRAMMAKFAQPTNEVHTERIHCLSHSNVE